MAYMSTRGSSIVWISAFTTFTVGILAAFAALLMRDGSLGDRLAATAAVLGGLIGAAGAAFAVYLTLIAQRADEAEKVEASLRAEVAEFARLAIGPLDIITRLIVGERTMHLQDIPTLVDLPDPVVFKATADRLARLPYGPLLVMFHMRIAEAKQLARMANLSVSKILSDHSIPVVMSKEEARKHATAWWDICVIAQTILLASERPVAHLTEAGFAKTRRNLEGALTHAHNVLSAAPGGPPSPPGDGGPSGQR